MMFLRASALAVNRTAPGDDGIKTPGDQLTNNQAIPAPELGEGWPQNPTVTAGFTLAEAGAAPNEGQSASPAPGAPAKSQTTTGAGWHAGLLWNLTSEWSGGV